MFQPLEQSPNGIGGWLILPLLGLIVSPLRLSYHLYATFWPLISEGYWEALTTPTSEAYHFLWKPLLIFEVVCNVTSIGLGLVALWLLLRNSRLTPYFVISWLAFSVVFVAVDYFLGDLIPAVAEQSDAESAKELMRSVIGAAVWIPYFLVSKRVEATFVK